MPAPPSGTGRCNSAAARAVGENAAQHPLSRHRRLLMRVCALYAHHTVGHWQGVGASDHFGDTMIYADEALFSRALVNLNQERTRSVVDWPNRSGFIQKFGRAVILSVHNESAMAVPVQFQVFQRSFSTKAQSTRHRHVQCQASDGALFERESGIQSRAPRKARLLR